MENYSSIIKSIFSNIGAVLCLTILLAASGFGQKQTPNYYAHLKAEHASAVKNYIGAKKNLRPAQVSDCKNEFGLGSLRQNAGKTAHPYYAAADFNGDKVPDFAVVLIDSNKKAGSRFRVLIFNGSNSGVYKFASTNGEMDLRQGGIWTDGFGSDETKTSVTAGVFETDDCIWIAWENGKYVTHECAEAEN